MEYQLNWHFEYILKNWKGNLETFQIKLRNWTDGKILKNWKILKIGNKYSSIWKCLQGDHFELSQMLLKIIFKTKEFVRLQYFILSMCLVHFIIMHQLPQMHHKMFIILVSFYIFDFWIFVNLHWKLMIGQKFWFVFQISRPDNIP